MARYNVDEVMQRIWSDEEDDSDFTDIFEGT